MKAIGRGARCLGIGMGLWLALSPIPGPSAQSPTGEARQQARFACPMHPDQQAGTAERCPICGMPMAWKSLSVWNVPEWQSAQFARP